MVPVTFVFFDEHSSSRSKGTWVIVTEIVQSEFSTEIELHVCELVVPPL